MNRKDKRVELITLEYIDAKFDRHMEQWRQDRKEEADRHAATMEKMEARIAADRKETAERLAADRKDAEERLVADRKDAEERLAAERKEARQEFNSQRRWLVANFVAVVVGMGGIFIALLVAIIAIINGGLLYSA